MFGVTILGNNSALPAFDRHPTAQVVTLGDQQFMVDCGEGTQMQMARYKIRHSRISRIFISHLHGDHYFGLIGLLTSMGLLSREQPLHLHAPPGLIDIIQLQLKVADTVLPYELIFHPLSEEGTIVLEEKLSVSCFRVFHRIECWGFVFRERKNPRKIDRDKAVAYGVPAAFYDRLKKGEDYTNKKGEQILNEWVTVPNRAPLSYAYCADTVYKPALCAHLQHVNLLYHETTYLADLEERAMSRFHSTTHQAAAMALEAGVHRLLIGHFSSKYDKLDAFLEETQSIFPATELALEGCTFLVGAASPFSNNAAFEKEQNSGVTTS
ncbi:ribonuclease Z [Parasegetibacter sp. NRK P23]|uniref:ribonuclease Z n=1 Tax=Parasegetibacter sp. NRK P23 TaxID=2942999 RepID=UPI002043A458|nr:ribonuclease Z [Parasegetibacter sp. NRK P23]MCM5527218.1 ribonuclease Z [Parasegetibacter sp. NRK P23]